ncbi:MAG: hypothetical protein RLZZ399_633 [Verrucomicrobiota bacterium]|jgi:autotransporter-associated beta strand protein
MRPVMKPLCIPLLFTMAVSSHLQAQVVKGPSSSETPYLTPTAPFWSATSILTVGDAVSQIGGGTYRMAGIPDGLGAFDNGDGTFTLLANHEIGGTSGIARAGTLGAFVSRWVVEKSTMRVVSGGDFLTSPSNLYLWNTTSNTWTSGTPSPISRLCSADLAPLSAFYNQSLSLGYNGRIFLNGEETGAEGRAFAWIVSGSETGRVYEVPQLGKFSVENFVANPFSGAKTAVVGTDDSTPGQVYVYIGDKTNSGNAVQRAGLANGTLYGVKVTDGGLLYGGGTVALESKGAITGSFTLTAPTYSTSTTGAALQTNSVTAGITEFARPEDVAWLSAGTVVFATTGATVGGTSQSAKIYRLAFSDANNLTAGGSISVLVDAAKLTGRDGQPARSFDNLTVGSDGLVYIQEDPGNNAYIAKHWVIDPNATNPTASALQIMESDRRRFQLGGADFRTIDEEHSGIIDITEIMTGSASSTTKYFLVATQNHAPATGVNAAELVEGGQFILLTKNGGNGSPLSIGSIASNITLSGDSIDAGTGTSTLARNLTLASTGGAIQADGKTTLSGKISGSGQLWKTGTGELILTAANDYTGNTNVSLGTLVNNGSLTSDVTVHVGGTLKGSGRSTGSLLNRGVFAPGNSPGIASYASYTEAGILDIEIGGTVAGADPAGFDQVRVTGAFVAESGTLRLTKYNGFDPARGQSFRVIQAASYSGTFALLDRNSQAFQALYEHSTGTVYGTGLTESQTFAEYGGKVANRRRIGAALYADALTSASVIQNGAGSTASTAKAFIRPDGLGAAAVNVLSASNVGLALDALSPESYIGLLEYSARTSAAVGRSLRSTPLGPIGFGMNVGFVSQRVGSTKSTTSLDTDVRSSSPFLAVTLGINENSALSLIGSIDDGRVTSNNLTASPEGNTMGIGWAAKLGMARIDLGLSHSIHDAKAVRAGQPARVDRMVGTVASSRITLDPVMGLTPFAGASFNAASFNQFTESGNGAPLNVAQVHRKRAAGELGVGYTRALAEAVVVDLSTSVEQIFPRTKTAISARFANAGASATPFTVDANTFGTTAFHLGSGLRINLGKIGAVGAAYELSAGYNLKVSHEFRANYSIQF